MQEACSLRKPPWLKRPLPQGPSYESMRRLISSAHLNTVCNEAKCPNRFECYQGRTATFMILGDRCTRGCRFCAVQHGEPSPPDANEAVRVALAIQDLGLTYAVITSVTRDDLSDGGAGMFQETITMLRKRIASIKVEVLTPDFQGRGEAIQRVVDAKPDVFGHNIETVKRRYPTVRPGAIYERSLHVLKNVHRLDPSMPIKSGVMVGLGETLEELQETFDDLLSSGCTLLTIGQYLSPGKEALPVESYITPDQFILLKELGLKAGFKQIESGPFVRSSYGAAQMFERLSQGGRSTR